MQSPFVFDWNACRRGTREVLIAAIDMFSNGKKIMSINMPTRYGKTPTGILLAGVSTRGWINPDGLHVKPFASVNVWVTVNLMLREQAANKDKWAKFNKLFSIDNPLRYGEITSSYENFKHFAPNNEEYLSMNIHKMMDNSADGVDIVFLKWIDHLLYTRNGLPPIFHFDESQFLGESKPWGKIIERIISAGALATVWTATPQRSDGGIIPGFIVSEIGHEERIVGVVEDTFIKDGEKYAMIDHRRVKVSDYEMRAHVNIPFSESWSNGYLLHTNHRMIDVNMTEVDGVTSEDNRSKKLSELTESTIKKDGIIGQVVRSQKVIRDAVNVAHEQFLQYKKINKHAAIAVFTVADRDGIKDEMAKKIKNEFLTHDPALQIDIATLNVDNSSDLIKNFVSNDHDIIIFKAMGGVGWDCERICVVLDLGDDRQDAASIQKWMRGGTPDGLNKNFALVTLQDALTMAIYKRCIEDAGGCASVSEAESLWQSFTKIEEKTKPIWVLKSAESGDFGDNQGAFAPREDAVLAKALIELISSFRAQCTDAELTQKANALGLRMGSAPQAEDNESIDEKIRKYQEDIIDNCSSAIRDLYKRTYGDYNKSKDNGRYGELSTTIYRMMYQRAGVFQSSVSISKNRDISQLEKLDKASQIIKVEMKRHEDLTV